MISINKLSSIAGTIGGICYHLAVISIVIFSILVFFFFKFHHELNCSEGAVMTQIQIGKAMLSIPCEGTIVKTAQGYLNDPPN